MIVAEITFAVDATGSLDKRYVANERFNTSPTDTPPNQHFDPSITDPNSGLGLTVFADGTTGGSTMLEPGELILANADGQYDPWLDYGVDGREIVIRQGPVDGAYPADFTTLLTAVGVSINANLESLIIQMKDKSSILDKAASQSTYLGSNTLPNGLEGVATDIKGQRKPLLLGKVFNAPPVLVNTSKLTYQFHTGALNAITAIYDRGVAKTFSADYATAALLQAATLTPGAGLYSTCLAEGYIRLHDDPAGLITGDVVQGATAADRTVAQLMRTVALGVGVDPLDIWAPDVVALDAACSYVVGIYIQDETSAREAMDQLARSIGAYYTFDANGILRMGQLTAPSGVPAAVLNEWDVGVGEDISRSTPQDNGVPPWAVTILHSKLYAVQATDLATSVSAARRGELASEFRSERAEDASVKLRYKLAGELEFPTLLTSAADAAAEGARQLSLLKVRRDIIEAPVPLEYLSEYSLNLLDVVSLVNSRFGLSGGKLFRLIGKHIALADDRAILTLWG